MIEYTISDAAKIVDVEPHVLRYWEAELNLKVPRNEIQRRYYGEKEVELMCMVKRLKEEGLQLRAIKKRIDNMYDGKEKEKELSKEEHKTQPKAIVAEDKVEEKAEDKAENEELTKNSEFYYISKNVCDEKVEEDELKLPELQPVYRFGETTNANNIMLGEAGTLQEGVGEAYASYVNKLDVFRDMMQTMIEDVVTNNNEKLEKNVSTTVVERVSKQMDYYYRLNEELEEKRYKKLDETIRMTQKNCKEGKRKRFLGIF